MHDRRNEDLIRSRFADNWSKAGEKVENTAARPGPIEGTLAYDIDQAKVCLLEAARLLAFALAAESGEKFVERYQRIQARLTEMLGGATATTGALIYLEAQGKAADQTKYNERIESIMPMLEFVAWQRQGATDLILEFEPEEPADIERDALLLQRFNAEVQLLATLEAGYWWLGILSVDNEPLRAWLSASIKASAENLIEITTEAWSLRFGDPNEWAQEYELVVGD